jgi:hypothetical protein
MVSVLLILFFNAGLQYAANEFERRRRMKLLDKWAKGELPMEKLLWLKEQYWFRKAFSKVSVEPSKKRD